MGKLKKYRVDYSFNGKGYAFLKATSEKDAESRFYEGLFNHEDDYDTSDTYDVEEVKEVL